MNFPPVAELLPHAGRAVLIDAVLDNTDTDITVTAEVTSDHPFFVAGHGVPAWVGIEMMAQAFAVHAGLSDGGGSHAPRSGMLLGTRHYHARVAWFAEGSRLVIHAARGFVHDSGMAACECRIESETRLLAEATIIILEEVDT